MTHCTKTKFVGLDVHKDSIVIAVAEEGREAARVVGTVPTTFKVFSSVVSRVGGQSQCDGFGSRSSFSVAASSGLVSSWDTS